MTHLLNLLEGYRTNHFEESHFPQTAYSFTERHHDQYVPGGKVLPEKNRRRSGICGSRGGRITMLAVLITAEGMTAVHEKTAGLSGADAYARGSAASNQL